MTAIDTTVALSSGQLGGLRAAGVTAVSRYIAPQDWKVITPAEYARYGPAGMEVVLNWESGAQDLRSLTVSQTRVYAAEAVRQAHACGYPRGCWIYNSADWNVMPQDWPTVSANLRAIRPIYAAVGYGLGLYAPWDALTWAQRDRLVDGYWQAGMSTSWSGGRNAQLWPGAHLRQRHSTTIAGVDCDTNDIHIPAFGQAGATPTGGTDMPQPTTSEVVRLLAQGSDDRGFVPLTGTPDVGAESVDPAAHYNLKAVMAKLDGLKVPPIDQAALNAAVAAALADPTVLASVAKAVNDDAARRQAE